MRLKASYTLADTRWLRGIEPFQTSSVELTSQVEEFDPFRNFDETSTCTSCRIPLPEERQGILDHYRSDWHRHNASRALRGQEPLAEELYEEEVEKDEVSSLSSDSDDDVFLDRLLGSTHEYFIQDGQVFSVYKCIVSPERPLDSNFFRMTTDCAIFMLAGGHFAGGIFKRGVLTLHKTIHRYTVRAKQGGAQSANDSKNGMAHSAGAALRRYNERALHTGIEGLIKECYQRQAFFSERLFDKNDQRIRSFPFETKRPSIDELKRAYNLLDSVFEHGTYEKFMEELKAAQNKKSGVQLTKKKKDTKLNDIIDSEEDEKNENEERQRKTERTEKKNADLQFDKEEREVLDPFSDIDKQWKSNVYAVVRNDDPETLQKLLETCPCDRERAIQFINEMAYPPLGNTLMHISASNGSHKALEYLLRLCSNLSIRNNNGDVPFQMSLDKSIRLIFMNFRANSNEDTRIDWRSTHIPVPTPKAEKNEEQLALEREKRKLKKTRQKENQRTKKAEEKALAEEAAAKEAWLALPDREKRARAAEARLAVLENLQRARCYQCGGVLPNKPFTYSTFEFCAPTCVSAHRATQPPNKNV
ncbi:unnamed protein product, partial [Mesorhabditis belari]|uniref:VLRF1 domain-containing protein n=1 Tax=Mesorhabditis belari TaxID=2138241 RepID=A0AAF3F7C3_9BILA